MQLYQIIDRFNGKILFELKAKSMKLCVETAVKEGANLTDADLTCANLTDADLTDADLTCADLTCADLTCADLTRAILKGAILTCADLTRAILKDADLTDAKLTDAKLTHADLTGSDLTGADLIHMQLGRYSVYVQKSMTRIGYDYHENTSWKKWTSDDVRHMAPDAAEWWSIYKPLVVQAIEILL